jgi:hypothetical protein
MVDFYVRCGPCEKDRKRKYKRYANGKDMKF